MPIQYHFDAQRVAIFGEITSPLTFEEFRTAIGSVVGSKEFPPNVRTLWDMREFKFKEVNKEFEEGLISVIEKFPERRSAKVALIVNDDLGLGKATIFENFVRNLGYQTMVFTNYHAGEKWLVQDLA